VGHGGWYWHMRSSSQLVLEGEIQPFSNRSRRRGGIGVGLAGEGVWGRRGNGRRVGARRAEGNGGHVVLRAPLVARLGPSDRHHVHQVLKDW
jgi:hypothetical protein